MQKQKRKIAANWLKGLGEGLIATGVNVRFVAAVDEKFGDSLGTGALLVGQLLVDVCIVDGSVGTTTCAI